MSYQQLTRQMGRIVDILGEPPAPPNLVPNIPQGIKPPKIRFVENDQRWEGLDMVLMLLNQDVEHVLR